MIDSGVPVCWLAPESCSAHFATPCSVSCQIYKHRVRFWSLLEQLGLRHRSVGVDFPDARVPANTQTWMWCKIQESPCTRTAFLRWRVSTLRALSMVCLAATDLATLKERKFYTSRPDIVSTTQTHFAEIHALKHNFSTDLSSWSFSCQSRSTPKRSLTSQSFCTTFEGCHVEVLEEKSVDRSTPRMWCPRWWRSLRAIRGISNPAKTVVVDSRKFLKLLSTVAFPRTSLSASTRYTAVSVANAMWAIVPLPNCEIDIPKAFDWRSDSPVSLEIVEASFRALVACPAIRRGYWWTANVEGGSGRTVWWMSFIWWSESQGEI